MYSYESRRIREDSKLQSFHAGNYAQDLLLRYFVNKTDLLAMYVRQAVIIAYDKMRIINSLSRIFFSVA